MEWTPFAGLTALDENDAVTIDGASFLIDNPRITDRLLQVGAVTHRHDAHPALPNPHVAMTGGAVASGGQLSASASYALTYTVLDQYGGETMAAPPLVVTIGPGMSNPTIAPSASVAYGSGIMPAGGYYYALTYTDGAGGETQLGPTTFVYVDPGFASATIDLSGLNAELGSAPAGADWRLWRSYEGADWHLVTQASGAVYADAGFDPPDNPALPPGQNTTGGTNALAVALPTAAQDVALASCTAIRVYLAPDSGFADPCFYEQLPAASAGATLLITSDTIGQGRPPHVSLSVPGARQINPDTDILDWHWKRPVSTQTALPSGGQGDVRMTLDSGHLWAVLGASGASAASQWTDLLLDPDPTGSGGGGGGLSNIFASAGNASAFVTALEFAASGGATVQLQNLGGGSAVIFISASGIQGPQGAPGASGAPGAQGPPGAPGAGASVGVGGSAATPLIDPSTYIEFTASGGAQVGVTPLGGGSARVSITAPGAGGGAGIAGIEVAASGGANPIIPDTYIEFAGSGGQGVAIQDLGGGSARVLIGPAPDIDTGGGGGGGAVSVFELDGVDSRSLVAASGFVAMPTPDRVTVQTASASDEIFVEYDAMWTCDSGTNVQAAIFVDGVQLTSVAPNNTTPQAVQATFTGGAGFYAALYTMPSMPLGGTTSDVGLHSQTAQGTPTTNTDDPFPGSLLRPGAPLVIRGLAAGSHTIEIRFTATTTTQRVYAKRRHLRAWVTGGGGTGSTSTPVVAASAGASAVSPDWYTEYAGSGGMGVAVQNLGGGSARVLIGPPATASGTDVAALHWRGPWSATNVYSVNDVVTASGESWRANQQSGPGTLFTPALTGTATVQYNGNDPGTVTVPATTKVGDLILIAVSTGSTTVTTPTGYALVTSATNPGGAHAVHLFLYSKTATSGDIGATVSIAGNTGWQWEAHVRSYTTGGLDQSATANAAAASLAPPTLSTSQALEAVVSFFATMDSNAPAGTSLAAGGSNTLTLDNSANFSGIAAEDWALATAGSSPTGGTCSMSGAGPAIAGISVSLKPSSPPATFILSQWDLIPPASGAVPTVAASAGASAVTPDYYTEYAGSGGIDVAVQNLGGGSARVLVGKAARVFLCHQASGQTTMAQNTWTKIQYPAGADASDLDTQGWFDHANHRFTPQEPGIYQIDALVAWTIQNSNDGFLVAIRKNGTFLGYLAASTITNNQVNPGALLGGQLPVQMNGTTDYLEIWAYTSAVAPPAFRGEGHFAGHKL